MINTYYLELPLSRTSFHGSKDVPAIEIRLYVAGPDIEPGTSGSLVRRATGCATPPGWCE